MGDGDRPNPLLARRAFVGLLGKGAVAVAIGGVIRFAEPERKFIRPPGALPEAEFLSLCTRCGKCQEECPRIITLVQITESVISVGTPKVLFNCSRCMRCNWVCPTAALQARR